MTEHSNAKLASLPPTVEFHVDAPDHGRDEPTGDVEDDELIDVVGCDGGGYCRMWVYGTLQRTL